jgi:L-ribulokinase
VRKIVASGGIARKDELMMQIFADVTGRTIEVAESEQAGAVGSAIAASVAAGVFPSMSEAISRFRKPPCAVYTPIPENSFVYERLFSEYKTLHEYFGKQNAVMKRLKGKSDIQQH